jgi:3-hydroxyisobutyrate dehydrogenase-like beta-hydroxyacid dehydrogenase
MKTTNYKRKVTVIGLGAMGSALANTFISNDFNVTVWNRDKTKAAPQVAKGAVLAPTLLSAITSGDLIVINVSDYKATKAILENTEISVDLKGKTVVQLSTGTPNEAREFEKWVKSHDGAYLDGDILAWPGQIGDSATTILVSGKESTFKDAQDSLKTLAGNLTYMGESIGSSAALFNAILSYLAGSWIGFCHGALVCEAEGLRVDQYGALLNNISSILGRESEHMGKVVQEGNYSNPESTIKTTGMDLFSLVQQAKDAGINDEFPKFAAGLFGKAMEAGYGLEEHAAIIKVMRKQA